MAALVVADHPNWRASDLELRSLSTSYTAVTLQQFHDRGYAPAELYFIIGADAFADLATWRAYPQIVEWAHFAVVSRPGHPTGALSGILPTLAARMVRPPLGPAADSRPLIILIDAPTAAVSSTAIRGRRAAGRTIAGLVTPSVETHIERHGLYATPLSVASELPDTPGRRRNDPPPAPAAGRLHGQG
jgi:nicotinate-nucleotide adenylyltransferase